MMTLWLLLFVCALPFVASFTLHYFWIPGNGMNHGEVLSPYPLPDIQGTRLGGARFNLGELRGKWLLLHIDSGACDRLCASKLYKMRQVRATQHKNVDRVMRVWLVTDDADIGSDLLREYEGTVFVRVDKKALIHFAAATAQRDHIWIVDPLGNLVVRYPADADPSGMKKDLTRLLRISRIG